jgi:hypothetical protein
MWSAEARNGESLESRALNAAWTTLDADSIFVPSTGDVIKRASASNEQRIEAAQSLFAERAAAYARTAARLEPLAARVATLTRGFEAKVMAASEQARVASAETADARIVLACLSRRAVDEQTAIPRRLQEAATLADAASHREADMQNQYRLAVTAIHQASG